MNTCHLRNLLVVLALVPCITNGQRNFHSTAFTRSGEENGMAANVPLNEINIHAFRHFHQLFPSGTTEEYWFKSEEGYQVSFMQDGRREQAWFNLRGGFQYSLKYYPGKEIPHTPGEAIRKKYPDYQVDVVTEISDGEKTFYLVKIISPASIKTLSISEGKIDVVEEMVNGSASR